MKKIKTFTSFNESLVKKIKDEYKNITEKSGSDEELAKEIIKELNDLKLGHSQNYWKVDYPKFLKLTGTKKHISTGKFIDHNRQALKFNLIGLHGKLPGNSTEIEVGFNKRSEVVSRLLGGLDSEYKYTLGNWGDTVSTNWFLNVDGNKKDVTQRSIRRIFNLIPRS